VWEGIFVTNDHPEAFVETVKMQIAVVAQKTDLRSVVIENFLFFDVALHLLSEEFQQMLATGNAHVNQKEISGRHGRANHVFLLRYE